MQDFDFVENEPTELAEHTELTMSVSTVCEKDGKKVAYVSFTDGRREAEGAIPDCVIIRNNGFTDEEKVGLELYMKANLASLKKMAASINVFDAITKST